MISYQTEIRRLLANGYTREKIAVETDLPFDAVRRWEKGSEPRSRHAQRRISALYRSVQKNKPRPRKSRMSHTAPEGGGPVQLCLPEVQHQNRTSGHLQPVRIVTS